MMMSKIFSQGPQTCDVLFTHDFHAVCKFEDQTDKTDDVTENMYMSKEHSERVIGNHDA